MNAPGQEIFRDSDERAHLMCHTESLKLNVMPREFYRIFYVYGRISDALEGKISSCYLAILMFKIRDAQVSDARSIAKVHIDSWRETYTQIIPDSYLSSLSYDARSQLWTRFLENRKLGKVTLVAVTEAEELVGFVTGGTPQETEHGYNSELAAIYLIREYQGKGIGKALFSSFVIGMKALSFSNMYLWVLKDNPTAAFYEKMGGRLIKSRDIEIGGKVLAEDFYGWNL